MMKETELKPAGVFHYFHEICQVPRPSKHEEKIGAFLKKFGEEHHLETKMDDAGNVVIRKPASKGKENLKTVILQGHMDMVCEKNSDVKHDFMKDPIESYVDGEWLKAKGTTLGADDGIGVATGLAILADDSIEHGPLECVFTVDEETQLTGATAMKEGFMNGDILINLDSEDDGQLFIGCAGGVNTIGELSYKEVAVPKGYYCFKVHVSGLVGGHSGDDINKNRACANKILDRFLTAEAGKFDMYLCAIDGGNLHNAIAREAWAVCAVPEEAKHAVRADLNVFINDIEGEYNVTEPNFKMTLETVDTPATAMDKDSADRLLKMLFAMPHGVFAMSQDIPGLVETSTNLASVKMRKKGVISVETSQRSSIMSARNNIATMVEMVMKLAGAKVTHNDGYPGWKPNTHSEILNVTVASYKKLFGEEPIVRSIHAGLECGLFLEKYPKLDMISFGPQLVGVHSPDEKLLIPTVDRFWKLLLDVLANIPEK
jgi:dipeptidase D